MKFTDLFVKRPVLAVVVSLVILSAGLQAIRSLSVRQYPRSDIAVEQVPTVYVGANADRVRGFITTPLDRVIASTKGSMVSVNLVANTNLRTPEEFRQLVIKNENGVVVRLGEVADVVLGAQNYEQDVRFNGETATFMGVWVLPTANSLEVIKQVRAALPEIQAQLPTGMKAGIPYDSTAYIQDAINEVLRTLTETLIIVIIVIFLF